MNDQPAQTPTMPTTPEEVQKLTDQLMADLGLQDLSDADKAQVMAMIRDRVNDTILLTLLENLSDQDAQALEEKLKAGATQQQALEFLADKAQSHSDKFAAALAKLYQDLKTSVA